MGQTGPGRQLGVDFSADGAILTVAYLDGTIRWLRWSDGAELLALFVEPQSRKWVAWTPSGYYMASAGGEDPIGWHVSRGWNQEADFFPASQFRAEYNRPDIVARAADPGRGRSCSPRKRCKRSCNPGKTRRGGTAPGRVDHLSRRRIAFLQRNGRDRVLAALALRLARRQARCDG
jgi:hypothetical protein